MTHQRPSNVGNVGVLEMLEQYTRSLFKTAPTLQRCVKFPCGFVRGMVPFRRRSATSNNLQHRSNVGIALEATG